MVRLTPKVCKQKIFFKKIFLRYRARVRFLGQNRILIPDLKHHISIAKTLTLSPLQLFKLLLLWPKFLDLFNNLYRQEGVWESFDDWIYAIRSFGNCVKFVFAVFLFFNGAAGQCFPISYLSLSLCALSVNHACFSSVPLWLSLFCPLLFTFFLTSLHHETTFIKAHLSLSFSLSLSVRLNTEFL